MGEVSLVRDHGCVFAAAATAATVTVAGQWEQNLWDSSDFDCH